MIETLFKIGLYSISSGAREMKSGTGNSNYFSVREEINLPELLLKHRKWGGQILEGRKLFVTKSSR